MFSESELIEAIEELEKAPLTFQNAEKLAVFYTLSDHLSLARKPDNGISKEITICRYEGTCFYQAISGRNAKEVWRIMNELMKIIKVSQPELYESTLRKINSINAD